MMIPSMSRLGRLLLLILAAWSLLAESLSGRVVAISDGGTIHVMHQGRAERVRLWGIDCRENRQPFSTRARQFTAALVFGKDVTVIVRDVDRYGRTVGEVILPDGRSLTGSFTYARSSRSRPDTGPHSSRQPGPHYFC